MCQNKRRAELLLAPSPSDKSKRTLFELKELPSKPQTPTFQDQKYQSSLNVFMLKEKEKKSLNKLKFWSFYVLLIFKKYTALNVNNYIRSLLNYKLMSRHLRV